jgi:chitin disaccharide deacetylase
MGAVGSLRFMPVYISVAMKYRLPPMIFRMDEQDWIARGIDPALAGIAPFMMNELEEAGLPLLDAIVGMDLGTPDDRLEQAKRAFSSLKPGITHFILHPSVDTPELRAIAPDWRARVADYETFMSEELQRFIQSQGIQVIGYRAIQSLMPDPPAAGGL